MATQFGKGRGIGQGNNQGSGGRRSNSMVIGSPVYDAQGVRMGTRTANGGLSMEGADPYYVARSSTADSIGHDLLRAASGSIAGVAPFRPITTDQFEVAGQAGQFNYGGLQRSLGFADETAQFNYENFGRTTDLASQSSLSKGQQYQARLGEVNPQSSALAAQVSQTALSALQNAGISRATENLLRRNFSNMAASRGVGGGMGQTIAGLGMRDASQQGLLAFSGIAQQQQQLDRTTAQNLITDPLRAASLTSVGAETAFNNAVPRLTISPDQAVGRAISVEAYNNRGFQTEEQERLNAAAAADPYARTVAELAAFDRGQSKYPVPNLNFASPEDQNIMDYIREYGPLAVSVMESLGIKVPDWAKVLATGTSGGQTAPGGTQKPNCRTLPNGQIVCFPGGLQPPTGGQTAPGGTQGGGQTASGGQPAPPTPVKILPTYVGQDSVIRYDTTAKKGERFEIDTGEKFGTYKQAYQKVFGANPTDADVKSVKREVKILDDANRAYVHHMAGTNLQGTAGGKLSGSQQALAIGELAANFITQNWLGVANWIKNNPFDDGGKDIETGFDGIIYDTGADHFEWRLPAEEGSTGRAATGRRGSTISFYDAYEAVYGYSPTYQDVITATQNVVEQSGDPGSGGRDTSDATRNSVGAIGRAIAGSTLD